MTGAMYSAIAGLKTHMSKLNVIGNNIANVNTNGYKNQRTVFRDAMYTMYSSGANGTTSKGGLNPSQVGYGSQIGSIDLNMTTSTFSPGSPMDCMLYGDGFFLVGSKDTAGVIDATNPESFKSLNLTRVGDFVFDSDGYLTDGKGNCVYGFMNTGMDMDGKPIVSDQLVPIRKPHVEKIAYTKTNPPVEEPNPDPAVEYDWKMVVRYAYDKTPGANGADDAYIPLRDYDQKLTADGAPVDPAVPLSVADLDSISINPINGCISATLKDTDEPVTIGYLAIGNVANPNGVTHTGESYYRCGEGAGDMRITMLGGVAEELGIDYVNGSLAVDPNDPDAAATLSEKSLIGSAGSTTMYTGGLEVSNVDLATEISELITTQRGYQANTRIITVTDTMLEELVNMKR